MRADHCLILIIWVLLHLLVYRFLSDEDKLLVINNTAATSEEFYGSNCTLMKVCMHADTVN
jgi:hypothetical protein